MNPYRGEVELVIDGMPCRLRLTLGALVELEQALGTENLGDLARRFEAAKPSVRDIALVVSAGLQGGGVQLPSGSLMQAEIQGGILGAARAAALLLSRAFALPEAGA